MSLQFHERFKPVRYFFYSLTFLIIAFRTYSGNNHIFYVDVYQFILNPNLYPNDIYLTRSMLFDATILDEIVSLLNLNFDNDFISFSIHIIFSSAAAIAVGAIGWKFLGIRSVDRISILILLVALLDHKLLDTTRGGVLFPHSNTPTMLAHYLVFVLFWFTLSGRLFWAGLLASVLLLLTVKAAYAPVLIAGLFAVADPRGRSWGLLWFLLPACTAILFSGGVGLPADPAMRLELTRMAILREEREAVLHMQALPHLLAFFLSLPIYALLARKVENPVFRRFIWIVFWITLVIVLAGGLYTWVGYVAYPHPLIVLLPVRATNVYVFFFFLLAFNHLLNRSEAPWHERLTLVGLLFVTRKPYVATWLVIWGIGILGGILLPRLLSHLIKASATNIPLYRWISGSSPVIPPLMIVPLLVFVYNIGVLAVASPINTVGLREFNKWTMERHQADEFAALNALRRCEHDFLLLAVSPVRPDAALWYTEGDLMVDVNANFVARKSKYIGDKAHFYVDYDAYIEHSKRERFVRAVLKSLLEGHYLPPSDLSGIQSSNVAVLSDTPRVSALQGQVPIVQISNTHALAIFERDNEVLKTVNECMNTKVEVPTRPET